jgi:NADH:ubiquinone oxidoreductase subunit E
MVIRAEVRKDVIAICAMHKDEPSPLMIILSQIQKKYGYIPLEIQEVVSQETGIPVAEIFGVVTFYNFFSLTPKGKYVIGVCLGTACYVKNSQPIIEKFQTLLGIKAGRDDFRWSLHHRSHPLHGRLRSCSSRFHQWQSLSADDR